MLPKLTFRADVNGKPFGVIVVRTGLATARAGAAVLAGVPLPFAMAWLSQRPPQPEADVQYHLVGRFDR